MSQNKDWDLILQPKPLFFSLGIKDIWEYRDLILLFVKRDIVSQYKQTILGPLWLVIQPLLSTIFLTVIFNYFAKFNSGETPYPIFILSGLAIWNFFSTSFSKTSNIFVSNATIFGKVYFPRLTVPISSIIANHLTFLIQFVILLIVILFYGSTKHYEWHVNLLALIFLPFILISSGLLGMGIGLIVSSLTTKYRDLSFLTGFILQFLMYFSAVAFPISSFNRTYQFIFNLNPVLHLVGFFRACILNSPLPGFYSLLYTAVFILVFLLMGMMIFQKVEKNFMDTV